MSLDKWEVADNISLYYVLQDYEEYQEIRLNKKPKLVKKLNDKLTLPKIKAKPGLARKPSAPAKSKSSDQEESASNGGLLLVSTHHVLGGEKNADVEGRGKGRIP